MCPWPVAKQCQAPGASSLSVPVAVPARVSCVGTQNTSHILFEFCFQFVHVPHREWQWTERVSPLFLSRRGPIDSSLRNSITINTCRDIPRVGGWRDVSALQNPWSVARVTSSSSKSLACTSTSQRVRVVSPFERVPYVHHTCTYTPSVGL